MGTGRASRRPRRRRIGAPLFALAFAGAASAAPGPSSPPPAQADRGPPTLEEFLAPANAVQPRLSPSGAHVAVIRRTDAIDQIVRVDLPSMSMHVIYQTAPARVCVVGASYGGYEAMEAAAREPGLFRCAAAVSGVSDLPGFLKWQRSFGRDSGRYQYWIKSIGDPVKDADKLAAASPYRVAADWKTPILLIHGDRDVIVPVEESRQMKRALERAGKPVRYVAVAGMGHGPSTDAQVKTVLTEIESFLAKSLQPTAAATATATPVHGG